MVEEIESINCQLILAMGNIPRYALTGIWGGITKVNGTMEYIDRVKAWVVWCVHPSSVLRSPNQNREYFETGVKKFFDELIPF